MKVTHSFFVNNTKYCYIKIEKEEDQLIKMSVDNGDSLSTSIKQELRNILKIILTLLLLNV